jgi:hypothetical protein
MQFQIRDTFCPMCHQPVSIATIEKHPTRPDVVLQNYQCVDCGPVMTKLISLREARSSTIVERTHK